MTEQKMTATEHARWLTGELKRLVLSGQDDAAAVLVMDNAYTRPEFECLFKMALKWADERRTDSRQLAAVPGLLEALKNLVDVHIADRTVCGGITLEAAKRSPSVVQALAAIAKAEGG